MNKHRQNLGNIRWAIAALFALVLAPAHAGNMTAYLDSTNGSSSFVVCDAASNALAIVYSDGRIVAGG